jgi:hypothetical protein
MRNWDHEPVEWSVCYVTLHQVVEKTKVWPRSWPDDIPPKRVEVFEKRTRLDVDAILRARFRSGRWPPWSEVECFFVHQRTRQAMEHCRRQIEAKTPWTGSMDPMEALEELTIAWWVTEGFQRFRREVLLIPDNPEAT